VQAVLDAMPHATLKPEDENTELDQKRTYRTTYMFSATMPPAVERLARKYLRRWGSRVEGWWDVGVGAGCFPCMLLQLAAGMQVTCAGAVQGF
jgi:hypothetical protein